jgi:hypothetical protein
MFILRACPAWAEQIQQIRHALTEDSPAIRFDNDFYRVCRAEGGCSELLLLPREGDRGQRLSLRERDLQVLQINGRPVEHDAHALDRLLGEPLSLDNALLELAEPAPARVVELHMLVAFCVVESLRNDRIATTIGQVIRTSPTGPVGAPTGLPLEALRDAAPLWDEASEALFQAMSPAARDIALRSRAQRTPLQRRFSERVDLTRVDARLQAVAREIKVLKRPGWPTAPVP